jgi:hypothetical protein
MKGEEGMKDRKEIRKKLQRDEENMEKRGEKTKIT